MIKQKSYEGAFDFLKLLPGANTLVAIRRDRHREKPKMIVCVYSPLDSDDPPLAAHFTLPVTMKDVDAGLDNDGKNVVIAASVTNDDHTQ